MGQNESHAIGPAWPMSIRTRLDTLIVKYDSIDKNHDILLHNPTTRDKCRSNLSFRGRIRRVVRHNIRCWAIMQNMTQNRQNTRFSQLVNIKDTTR